MTFFEKDMPVVLNTLVSIVGSAAILFYYDLVIGAVAALLFIPVAIINRRYMRRSLMLNEGLNNQLEHEVQVSIAIQLIDTKRNVILWESSRLTGRGTYNLASQTFEDGRAVAIQDLTRQIVDGAQSQW